MVSSYSHLPPRVRRGTLRAVVALVLTLAALGAGATTTSRPAAAFSASTPMLWGEFGNSKAQLLEREKTFGRAFGLYRIYKSFDQSIDADMLWARDNGRIPLLSIKATSGGRQMSFSSIANAAPGSATYNRIVAWGKAFKNYRAPLYVIFNHEPDANFSRGSGNATQFVAAWRKLVTVWRNQGVTNAKYVFTATAWGFKKKSSDPTAAPKYYPGDAYVDDIGADGYNWYACRTRQTWTELSVIIDGLRAFGTQHPSKGLMLPEWGSSEDPKAVGTHKAQWTRNAAAMFAQPAYAQFVGVTAWGGTNGCRMDFNTSSASRQALADMGRQSKFSSRTLH